MTCAAPPGSSLKDAAQALSRAVWERGPVWARKGVQAPQVGSDERCLSGTKLVPHATTIFSSCLVLCLCLLRAINAVSKVKIACVNAKQMYSMAVTLHLTAISASFEPSQGPPPPPFPVKLCLQTFAVPAPPDTTLQLNSGRIGSGSSVNWITPMRQPCQKAVAPTSVRDPSPAIAQAEHHTVPLAAASKAGEHDFDGVYPGAEKACSGDLSRPTNDDTKTLAAQGASQAAQGDQSGRATAAPDSATVNTLSRHSESLSLLSMSPSSAQEASVALTGRCLGSGKKTAIEKATSRLSRASMCGRAAMLGRALSHSNGCWAGASGSGERLSLSMLKQMVGEDYVSKW